MEALKSISEHCLIALVLKRQNVNASVSKAVTAQNKSKASKKYNPSVCLHCLNQSCQKAKQTTG